jgi:putative sigma-54 modulation protein
VLNEGVFSVQITISTRHGHLSDDTQVKIKEKLEKLLRFYDRLTAIAVTVDLEHREAPNVDLRVSAEHKHDFVAESRALELMASMDDVVEKMEQQLRKYKEKVQERNRGTARRQMEVPETPGVSAAEIAAPDGTPAGEVSHPERPETPK